MNEVCDVVVVGCGVIGAAITYYLSAAGMKVIAVDRSDIASGTSSACDGNILAIDKEPGFDSRMALESQKLFETLEKELSFDLEYRHLGSTLAVEDEYQVEQAAEWEKAMRESGLDVRLIGPSDVHSYEPMIAEDVLGLLECASDASLNPIALVRAYVLAARGNGAVIEEFTGVKDILVTADGRVAGVETDLGKILAPFVVLAAGVWTTEIAKRCGICIPILPRKGHIIVSERTFRVGSRKIQEFGYLMAKFGTRDRRGVDSETEQYGIAMVFEPTPHGNFLIGSSREFVGFDTSCNTKVVALMAKRAMRFFPCIKDIRVIRTYAGLRPYTPDHRPIISEVDGISGLYVASGHEGDGIGLAPITGVLVRDMVLKRPSQMPLEPLSLRRFA